MLLLRETFAMITASCMMMLLMEFTSTSALIVPTAAFQFTRASYGLNSNRRTLSTLLRRNNASPLVRLASKNDDNTESTTPPPTKVSSSASTSTASSSSSSTASTSSLWTRLDDMGQGCKKQGNLFRLKAQTQDLTTIKRVQFVAQACGFYTLFIMYRAYRGCFVILPAVFREVSRKLERAVELEDVDDGATVTGNDNAASLDVNPETGKLRWRTRITVAILASIVTLSYVLGGALRVIQSFGQTVTRTASVSTGFEAAADQVVRNENQILQRITKTKPPTYLSTKRSNQNNDDIDSSNGSFDSLNGQFPDSGLSSGLAP